MLTVHGTAVMHWAVAGAALGAITLLLFYVANRRLGVSGGFENLCALGSRLPLFRRTQGHGWRLYFLAGLVLGGVLSRSLQGSWSPTWAMGMFDRVVGLGPAGKLAWMFGGGLLVGFGTRLAGGCTSGHGIFGVSNRELASLASTVAFMLGGLLTTNLIYRVLF